MSDLGGPLPFDLRALDVFLTVCEAGGMAQAARRLGITQPSVSQTIAEIEQRTGARLFDRAVRPLGLTPAGVLLRQRAGLLLAEARQIGPLLRQVARGRLPTLRVGLVDSLMRPLSGLLAGFLAEVAEQSSLLSGLTASHAAALTSRQIDLFLGAEEVEDAEGLERHLLLEESYVLLCPAGTVPPNDLAALTALAARLPLVRFSARSRTGVEIERHLRRLRLDLPRRQEFDTPHGVTAAVAAGLGWAITTPLCIADAALPDTRLMRHPLPGPRLMRRLVLIARQRELGTLPQRMAALCRAALQEELARAAPP
ncbi:LysR family transcriptional regulator [Roseicella aquatilis]|nr:LysR family transcriptional regulator [Roseicella aquatilis]